MMGTLWIKSAHVCEYNGCQIVDREAFLSGGAERRPHADGRLQFGYRGSAEYCIVRS